MADEPRNEQPPGDAPPQAPDRTPATPAGAGQPAAPEQPAAELSREERIAQAKARAAAAAAARTGAAPAKPAAPAAGAPAAPRGITSSLNPGGQPAAPVQHPTVTAFGTVNQSVELTVDPAEDANIRKLLGGIGAYQNPLRENRWQIDYRYFQEARRRLAEAGYTIEGVDFMGRPLETWQPHTRGWTRVE